jgi:hypothetical protein
MGWTAAKGHEGVGNPIVSRLSATDHQFASEAKTSAHDRTRFGDVPPLSGKHKIPPTYSTLLRVA